jgi:hypothetical protein
MASNKARMVNKKVEMMSKEVVVAWSHTPRYVSWKTEKNREEQSQIRLVCVQV